MLNVTATYDSRGRPLQVTKGLRSTTVAWGGGAFPLSVTDALARATGFQYDAVGRATKVTLPEGEALQLGYDGVGNIVRLTPPNTLASDFGYTAISQLASYQPPALPGIGSYGYAYDLDGALKIATHPDATTSQYQRDTAGRLTKLKAPWGDYDFGYEPGTGQMKSAAHGGQSIQWSYDGFLLTAETATGPVKGTVGYSFDDDFRVASLAVNGAAVAYAFDGDGLLTAAGSLVLARSPATGQLLSGTQGVVDSRWSYDGYGALETATARVSGATIFQEVIVRDALARPASKTEVVQGVTVNWTYRYDAANRLQQVTKDGATVGTYLFDANGNRTSANGVAATFDAQDRLLNAGAVQYRYDAFGSVIDRRDTATTPAPLTQYQYDGNGGLRKATLPDGTVLDYVVDARARRVGKKRNGVLDRAWLYDGQLRIVAELNGAGAAVSRYVYGVLGHSPDYLEREGVVYRFVHDNLGSVRLVVNSVTGAVAQRIDYDAWGVVLADSAPGFQPFGFAGGLYDGDLGLVRFGARDYDPALGRWLSPEPLLQSPAYAMAMATEGYSTPTYAYALNNPVQYTDPDGRLVFLAPLIPIGIKIAIAAGVGFGVGVAVGVASNSGSGSEGGGPRDPNNPGGVRPPRWDERDQTQPANFSPAPGGAGAANPPRSFNQCVARCGDASDNNAPPECSAKQKDLGEQIRQRCIARCYAMFPGG